MTQAEFTTPLLIPDEDAVYRQAFIGHLVKLPANKNIRYPSESHFKPDPDGLSVHWCRYIGLNGVYHILGLSYRKGTTQYKDYKAFRVFTLPVEYLRLLEGIQEVTHSPVFNGDPAKIGFPNNYAHTSVIYPDDEEIRMKLSDYCMFYYDNSYRPADFALLDTEINKLRERLDNTPYHRLTPNG